MVISHDRWFLDRIATHILAFEGDSKVVWFEGNYQDYEADRKRRLGADADQPHRIKYQQAHPLASACRRRQAARRDPGERGEHPVRGGVARGGRARAVGWGLAPSDEIPLLDAGNRAIEAIVRTIRHSHDHTSWLDQYGEGAFVEFRREVTQDGRRWEYLVEVQVRPGGKVVITDVKLTRPGDGEDDSDGEEGDGEGEKAEAATVEPLSPARVPFGIVACPCCGRATLSERGIYQISARSASGRTTGRTAPTRPRIAAGPTRSASSRGARATSAAVPASRRSAARCVALSTRRWCCGASTRRARAPVAGHFCFTMLYQKHWYDPSQTSARWYQHTRRLPMTPRRCWTLIAAALAFVVVAAVAPTAARACGGYGPSVEVVARCGAEVCRDAEVTLFIHGVRHTARTDESGSASFYLPRAGNVTVAATFHRGQASEQVGGTSATLKPYVPARIELALVPTGGALPATVAAR